MHRTIIQSTIICAMLCIIQPIFAQTIDSEELQQELESEIERKWNVVILPFITNGRESIRNSPLAIRLPSLIQESLSQITTRTLTTLEFEAYVSTLQSNYPELQIESENIPISRDIVIQNYNFESAILHRLFNSGMHTLAQDQTPLSISLLNELQDASEADLFISGKVEIQEQYLFLDIFIISPYVSAANSLVSQVLFTRRNIEALNELEEFVVWDLGRLLYNEAAGRLEILEMNNTSEPRLYINNEYIGILPILTPPLAIGDHSVELYSENNLLYSSVVTVKEDETLTLNIELEAAQNSPLLLNTVPSGVSVYSYNHYLGVTPLFLNKLANEEYYQLFSTQVRNSYFQIADYAEDTLTLALTNLDYVPSEQVSTDREEFYSSFGLTIISAILPLVLTGINNDRTIAINSRSLSGTALQNFQRDSAIISGLTISSIAVSIVLLINTADELLDYLLSAEYARSIIQ